MSFDVIRRGSKQSGCMTICLDIDIVVKAPGIPRWDAERTFPYNIFGWDPNLEMWSPHAV